MKCLKIIPMVVFVVSSGLTAMEKEECAICFELRRPREIVTLSCKHRYCRECLSQIVHNVVKAKNLAILRCPNPKCNNQLEVQEVRSITGDQKIADAVEELKTQRWYAENGVRNCPTPDCTFMFENEGVRHAVQCPKCNRQYCSECLMQHDDNLLCEEAKERYSVKDTDVWVKKFTKACPKCGTRIEKNGGCPHMTCTRCKHEFWWDGVDSKTAFSDFQQQLQERLGQLQDTFNVSIRDRLGKMRSVLNPTDEKLSKQNQQEEAISLVQEFEKNEKTRKELLKQQEVEQKNREENHKVESKKVEESKKENKWNHNDQLDKIRAMQRENSEGIRKLKKDLEEEVDRPQEQLERQMQDMFEDFFKDRLDEMRNVINRTDEKWSKQREQEEAIPLVQKFEGNEKKEKVRQVVLKQQKIKRASTEEKRKVKQEKEEKPKEKHKEKEVSDSGKTHSIPRTNLYPKNGKNELLQKTPQNTSKKKKEDEKKQGKKK